LAKVAGLSARQSWLGRPIAQLIRYVDEPAAYPPCHWAAGRSVKRMQGMLKIILGIILLLILIVILSYVLGYVLAFVLTGGVGIVLMRLALCLFRLFKIKRLKHEALAKLITVRFDGQKLDWSLDESQIESYGKPGLLVMFFIIALGIASAWMMGWLLAKLLFHESYQLNWWDIVILAIIIIAAKVMSNPGETFKNKLRDKANHLVRRANILLEKVEELRLSEAFIKSVASRLEISLPINFQSQIQGFVNAHKTELLADASELNNVIAGLIRQSHEYESQLEKANSLYQDAMQLYRQTAHEVNETRSKSLIKEMEYVYSELDDAKALLSMKKWNDFSRVLRLLMGDLLRLHGTATEYQEEGSEAEYEEQLGITDEHKAYRIFGIPPTATGEQIKQVYRKLAKIYHKDAGLVADEMRMKEINWAFDILGKTHGVK
jgi:DnaJ-domain-containing protein 1